MVSDPELWKKLKPGDRVVVTRLPEECARSDSGYNETQFAYEWLIARRYVLTIDHLETVDGVAYPWTSDFVVETYGVKEWHSLLVNHDGLERVG